MHRRRGHAPAFTLIEALLATALGSAVVATVGIAAVQALASQRSADVELAKRWKRLRIAAQFEADLGNELSWLPSSIQTLEVQADGNRLLRIITLAPGPSVAALFEQRLPAQVTYSVETPTDSSGHKRLVRAVRYLTRPDQGQHRHVLADDLLDARLVLFEEGSWQPTTGTSSTQTPRPEALRLQLTFKDSDPETASFTVIVRARDDSARPAGQ